MLKSLAIVTLSLFAALSSAQQWEQVGWRGGAVQIQAQSGNTLYGKAGTGYYKSTNWGTTWILDRQGLPCNYPLYGSSMFEFNGEIYLGSMTGYRAILSPLRNGIFVTSESEKWEAREFTAIDKHPFA